MLGLQDAASGMSTSCIHPTDSAVCPPSWALGIVRLTNPNSSNRVRGIVPYRRRQDGSAAHLHAMHLLVAPCGRLQRVRGKAEAGCMRHGMLHRTRHRARAPATAHRWLAHQCSGPHGFGDHSGTSTGRRLGDVLGHEVGFWKRFVAGKAASAGFSPAPSQVGGQVEGLKVGWRPGRHVRQAPAQAPLQHRRAARSNQGPGQRVPMRVGGSGARATSIP